MARITQGEAEEGEVGGVAVDMTKSLVLNYTRYMRRLQTMCRTMVPKIRMQGDVEVQGDAKADGDKIR